MTSFKVNELREQEIQALLDQKIEFTTDEERSEFMRSEPFKQFLEREEDAN